MKGLIYCVKCGATISRDSSGAKNSMMTIQDRIEFTNAELRTLVWKENRGMRGIVTDPDAQLLKRARKLSKRAHNGATQLDGSWRTFENCVHRWDNDDLFRTNAQREERLN